MIFPLKLKIELHVLNLDPLEMKVTSAVNLIHATQWKPSSMEKIPQIYRDVNFLSQKKVLVFAIDFLLQFV